MDSLEFAYTAKVEETDAIYQSEWVHIPLDIVVAFKNSKIKRVIGTINSYPFKLAIHNNKKENYSFLLAGKALRKAAQIEFGQHVEVTIKPDPNPDAIVLPEEWEEYLNQDEEAREVWDAFTPGMQRSLSYYISTAKTIETRIKRSIDLGLKLKNRDLSFFKNKDKQA